MDVVIGKKNKEVLTDPFPTVQLVEREPWLQKLRLVTCTLRQTRLPVNLSQQHSVLVCVFKCVLCVLKCVLCVCGVLSNAM